ncbi:MAG: hypothetical protein KGQ54_04095 [Verrucomicrobia bacterium]|nr:hypothetical protein [Verrucomicrobiota bacterium]
MNKVHHYLKIIDKIEKIRTKNNLNWMNILRIAFKKDPVAARKCFRKINRQDKKISQLAAKLCR